LAEKRYEKKLSTISFKEQFQESIFISKTRDILINYDEWASSRGNKGGYDYRFAGYPGANYRLLNFKKNDFTVAWKLGPKINVFVIGGEADSSQSLSEIVLAKIGRHDLAKLE